MPVTVEIGRGQSSASNSDSLSGRSSGEHAWAEYTASLAKKQPDAIIPGDCGVQDAIAVKIAQH